MTLQEVVDVTPEYQSFVITVEDEMITGEITKGTMEMGTFCKVHGTKQVRSLSITFTGKNLVSLSINI